GYVTDAVIVNRQLPSDLHDELFQKWQRIHHRYQLEVEQSFAGIPIFNVPLFDREVVGEKMLARMARAIYGDGDPSARFVTSNSQRIDKDGQDFVLSLKVPFVEKSAVDLSRHNGELFVTVGNYRREISLPRVLARRDTAGASIEDGELRVRFVRRRPSSWAIARFATSATSPPIHADFSILSVRWLFSSRWSDGEGACRCSPTASARCGRRCCTSWAARWRTCWSPWSSDSCSAPSSGRACLTPTISVRASCSPRSTRSCS